ncbi:uncharacterized protein N7469_002236 [Penicillium citrinum]|uniref:Uncharacterized protein n=1 Tax=Penicillium citrinum TaxID=5077 RepID=A0A9W9PAA3_PENCI|nr:uncharacterized protein N7469_002236 [Penicillium citrinum]KAJ5240645.1 hypothetical protein N7469_002236 [Penicillium citrinum]
MAVVMPIRSNEVRECQEFVGPSIFCWRQWNEPAAGEHWAYYASLQSTVGAAFGAMYHTWSVEVTWRFRFTQ